MHNGLFAWFLEDYGGTNTNQRELRILVLPRIIKYMSLTREYHILFPHPRARNRLALGKKKKKKKKDKISDPAQFLKVLVIMMSCGPRHSFLPEKKMRSTKEYR